MIGTENGGTNDVVLDMFHEALRDEEVVQAPSDVLGSGVAHVAPEGVGSCEFRVEVTECVDEAQRQKLGEAIAFFLSETSVSLVRFGIGQVNFLVRDVHVACDDHRLLLVQLLHVGVESIVELEALFQRLQAATRVDDVGGNDKKLLELCGDQALLFGEVSAFKVEGDLNWLDFAEKTDTAGSLPQVPVGVVAFELVLVGNLLEAAALDLL
jgi:hypothetical protein